MMSLSQTTGYAIQALACLAEERCSPGFIRTIAECTGVPAPYLAKIFKRLNDAGLVASKRGYRGGVWLTRPPNQITLLDISDAVDGPAWMNACLLGPALCDDARSCPTHRFWKKERAAIRKELAALTLADMVKFNHKRARRPGKASPKPET